MHIGHNSLISAGAIVEQPDNIYIGDNVSIKHGVVLRPETGYIYIGNNVVINHYTVIHAKGGVEIGDWCIIAPHCGIYAQNHAFDSFDVPITKQPSTGSGVTLMGDNWLGANSIILDGVTLGKGTVVGAGSVVTKAFPMAKVIAGNPAKIIRGRARNSQWDFHSAERYSISHTPDTYKPYIDQRVIFARRHMALGDTVLDIGVGEGYVAGSLKPYCTSIVGIDYSEEAVEIARKQYSLECYHMPSTNLRFESGAFDKVLCFELLEHLTILQAKRTLAEIFRVLKKGGLLIGSTPLRDAQLSMPKTYSHIYEYSKPELALLLSRFQPITIDGNCFTARRS